MDALDKRVLIGIGVDTVEVSVKTDVVRRRGAGARIWTFDIEKKR
jgi:hypothetical protein